MNNDLPQADSPGSNDLPMVTVDAVIEEDISSKEMKVKEELEKIKQTRAKECNDKIKELLEQYNCTTDVMLTISSSGKIVGSTIVRSK